MCSRIEKRKRKDRVDDDVFQIHEALKRYFGRAFDRGWHLLLVQSGHRSDDRWFDPAKQVSNA